ncbi:hypothetical protein M8J76_001317 [Diaphorina citri]|nr:hypothetical protein M8J76_001317 [Diaphorina citri]KAI5727300.1 hypothetical protein M8J77_000433 [Diaphorina citri]
MSMTKFTFPTKQTTELDVEKLQKPLTGSGVSLSRRSPPLRKPTSVSPLERSLKETFLAASPILIKLVELILCLLSIGTLISPFSHKLQLNIHRAGGVYFAYFGALCAILISLSSHFLFREKIPRKTAMLRAWVFAFLTCLSSLILIYDWRHLSTSIYSRPSKHYLDLLLTSAIFGLLTSASFFADIVLTFKFYS